MKYHLSEQHEIPGYSDYLIRQDLSIRRKGNYNWRKASLKNKLRLISDAGETHFLSMELITLLYAEARSLAFLRQPPITKPLAIIHRISGEGRAILDRFRFSSLCVRFFPNASIWLTPDKSGLFRTTADLKAMGVHCCPECGHPQPIEIVICKNCNQYITK